MRPDRISAYPWRRPAPPALVDLAVELVDAGARRIVLAAGGMRPDPTVLAALTRAVRAEVLVAGGVGDLNSIGVLRDMGVAGIILGEPLVSGAIDFARAVEAAA